MKRWLVKGFALAWTLLPSSLHADTLTRGQAVTGSFLRGDVHVIWAGMTPEMQAALNSVDALMAVRGDLLRTFGSEESILTERTVRQESHDVYERTSRWTGSPMLLRFVVAVAQDERIAGFFVRPQMDAAPSRHLDYQTKATLRLPINGAWHVYWGGRETADNYHAVDGVQRFAIDLLVMRDGQSHSGNPTVLENHYCWDQPILAPADGVVVRAVDGLPDQRIGSTDPGNPAGNHVVIDFGNGEYGFLAHMRQGSLRVSKGDRIKAGLQIGQCGNSGNTSEPHLHFHLQTSPQLGRGDGLPAHFVSYFSNGIMVERGEPTRGQTIHPAGD